MLQNNVQMLFGPILLIRKLEMEVILVNVVWKQHIYHLHKCNMLVTVHINNLKQFLGTFKQDGKKNET